MAQQGPKSMGDMVGGGRPDHGRAYEVQRASEERTFVEFRDGTSVELITAKVLPAEPRTFTGSDRVAGPQAISRRGQDSPVYDRGDAGPFGPQSMDAIFDAQFASVEAAKAEQAAKEKSEQTPSSDSWMVASEDSYLKVMGMTREQVMGIERIYPPVESRPAPSSPSGGRSSMQVVLDAQRTAASSAKAQKAGAVDKGLAQAQQMSEASQQAEGSRELD